MRRWPNRNPGPALFAAEQLRVHAEVNRIWPRRLGTTPWGMARALTAQGVHGWGLLPLAAVPRPSRRLADVVAAVDADRPVAMLVGRFIPRHWVLVVDAAGDTLTCYEPSSGELRTADVAAVRESRLTGLGYRRPFAFVVPRSNV